MSSSNTSNLFENFSSLLTNNVLVPISNYLRVSKNLDVSVQELQSVIECNKVQQSVPSMPSTLPSNSMPFPKLNSPMGLTSFNNINQQQGVRPGVCQYIFAKSVSYPNRPCDKPAYPGTRYCKACWSKKTTQTEALKNGEQIPQEIVEKQRMKAAGVTAVGSSFTLPSMQRAQPTLGFPNLQYGLNNMPPTNLTGAIFNPNAGRPTLPSTSIVPQPFAPLQSNNPYQTGATTAVSMSFLDEKMNELGINSSEYAKIETYLIGPNNIIYSTTTDDLNKPDKAVGVLDTEHKSIRPLLEQEKHLIVSGTTYDPSLTPIKVNVHSTHHLQPQMPAFSLATNPIMPTSGFKSTLPVGLKPGIPSFFQNQPPKINTLQSVEDETEE